MGRRSTQAARASRSLGERIVDSNSDVEKAMVKRYAKEKLVDAPEWSVALRELIADMHGWERERGLITSEHTADIRALEAVRIALGCDVDLAIEFPKDGTVWVGYRGVRIRADGEGSDA